VLRLRTFGGVSVERDGKLLTAATTSRRRIALLPLLAAEGERGLSRDKVLAYLWPESDEERARNALAQTLHALRRDLGEDELFLTGRELRLNPEAISSDVGEFAEALKQGALERAASLYEGPFLDGFHLTDAREFERWVANNRERFAAQVKKALKALATGATQLGDHDRATRWWRRLAVFDWLDSEAAVGLATALAAAGNRVGALQHLRIYESLVRRELDAAPDAQVLALAERLRCAPAMEAEPTRAVKEPTEDTVAAEPKESYLARSATAIAVVAEPHPIRSSSRRLLAGAVAGALVLGATVLWSRYTARRGLDPNLVAVAPFDVLDPQLALWREGLVDIVSRDLDGAGPVRAVSPTVVIGHWQGHADRPSAVELGRQTGAQTVVYGAVFHAGRDSVRLAATVLNVATGRSVGELSRREISSRMDLLADSLAVGALRELGRTRPIGAVRSIGFGTRSIPALKEFLQGEQFFRHTAWDSALAHYGRAVAFDSAFAVALWRLAWVYREARDVTDPRGHEYLLLAGALNHGLAPRESLLLTADSIHGALLLHTSDTAYSVLLRRLFATLDGASEQYPADPDVWNTVGRARAQFGHVVGLSVAQTLDAYERAIRLDSAFGPSYENAVDLSLKLRDSVAARRYVDAYFARNPASSATPSMRFVAEFLRPAPSRSKDLARALDTLPTGILDEIWYLIGRWPDSAETAVRIARRSVILVGAKASDTGPYSPAEWRPWLVRTLAYRGHIKEAYRSFTAFDGFAGSVIYVDLALLHVLPTDSARAEFEGWLRAEPGRKTPLPLPWWSAQGDTVSLAHLMRRCDSIIESAPPNAQATRYALHGARVARAYLALAHGDTATALRQLEPLPDGLCPHCTPDVLARARLLKAKRRYSEAASLLDRGPPTLLQPLPRPAEVLWELERARVHERLGDRQAAIAAYRFVAAVWANADPELQPYVAEARAAIERLGR